MPDRSTFPSAIATRKPSDLAARMPIPHQTAKRRSGAARGSNIGTLRCQKIKGAFSEAQSRPTRSNRRRVGLLDGELGSPMRTSDTEYRPDQCSSLELGRMNSTFSFLNLGGYHCLASGCRCKRSPLARRGLVLFFMDYSPPCGFDQPLWKQPRDLDRVARHPGASEPLNWAMLLIGLAVRPIEGLKSSSYPQGAQDLMVQGELSRRCFDMMS